MTTEPPAVRMVGVDRRFRHVDAVLGMDLTIGSGETIALLGPNGAGKSTTINLMLGLVPPDRGLVELFGITPARAIADGRIGAMLQDDMFLPSTTVRDFVTLARRLYTRSAPVGELLAVAGLTDKASTKLNKLSGGEAKRARFAFALAGDPDLIILDEPTAAMDVAGRQSFWATMRRYAERGTTIIFATHYLEEADDFADRIIVMAHGRIIADGTAAEVKKLAAGRTVAFALCGSTSAGLDRLPGVRTVDVRGDRVTLAVVALARGKTSDPFWSSIGLAAFVILYLIVVVRAFDGGRPVTPFVTARLLVLAAIGITLLWVHGLESEWANTMLYVTVSGVAVFARRWAIAWVVGCTLVIAAYCTYGPGRAMDFPDKMSFGYQVAVASALVFTIKQMIRYIGLLRRTREMLAENAVSDERLRFARDLHDLLGHTLSVIVVKAEVVRRLAEQDPAGAAREAADIESIGRKALADVRDAVGGYRDVEFASELEGVRAALSDAGIRVTIDVVPLPRRVEGLFGWAVREAATNVIRHSRARTVSIVARTDGEAAHLDVTDDGIGARNAHNASGTGLRGLRERFAAADGSVATSSDGRGFCLMATLPLQARTSADAVHT